MNDLALNKGRRDPFLHSLCPQRPLFRDADRIDYQDVFFILCLIITAVSVWHFYYSQTDECIFRRPSYFFLSPVVSSQGEEVTGGIIFSATNRPSPCTDKGH
jgi:hypothetical protein